MASYGKSRSLSSEESSEEERVGVWKKKHEDDDDDESNRRYTKKRKISLHSQPSYASTHSSISTLSESEEDASPIHFGDKDEIREVSEEEEEEAEEAQSSSFSNKAQKIMMNMGYKKGKGLGKFQQGIVDPISASQQRGRRGLGFVIDGLEPMENLTWDKSQEHIEVKEEPVWYHSNTTTTLDLTTLLSWVKEGSKKLDISEETHFCHPKILQQVLSSKSVFDNLNEREMYKARGRSNPFETIGKLFFQNRAALKMANMDAVFEFMFTEPVDENGKTLIDCNDLFYFADVCAAPGGFSEYVLWRRKDTCGGFCDAKGFGFTLRENDFKLHDFFAAPPEFFEPHYGVNGNHGDGNIYFPNNITNFRDFVLRNTGGEGVHLMMADGGFSVEGQENLQEILSKRLYLCQFLVALGIVRKDGHFVCKLFDVFTPFSVGLVYIMSRCFKYISLHKPNSSRPANSERYLICKWRNKDVEDAYEYLFKINSRLDEFGDICDKDVTDLVSLEILKEDVDFYNYICESNNVLGERQAVGLQKIRAFCQDTDLFEERQAEIRRECLTFWQLPEKPRVAPARMDPKAKAMGLCPQSIDLLSHTPEEMRLDNFKESIRSPYDFRFVFLASSKDSTRDRGFFLGLGGPNVYISTGKDSLPWQRVDYLNLPPDTLLYGELVMELRGEQKAQRKVRAMHCIDALVLNGFDVTGLHLVERHSYLKKFAAAINKESRNDLFTIRCKPVFKLEEAETILRPPLIDWRIMKGGNAIHRRVYNEAEATEDSPSRYTLPTGLMLLKITQEPWMMAYSKTQNRKYWFNTHTRDSTYQCYKQVIAPFSVSFRRSAVWWWNAGVQILESEEEEEDKLHLKTLIDHIKGK